MLGVCPVPRPHSYEKDFETVETANVIDVASDYEQQAVSSSQVNAGQLTGSRGVHWAAN
jgi:hypothetical protein